MSDQGTTPPYAAELARIAMFTVLEVQARRGPRADDGRETHHLPDEWDFEKNFTLYLKRLVLESEIRMGQLSSVYKVVIDKVIELDAVQKEIDELEARNNLNVRTWKNTGVVKPDASG